MSLINRLILKRTIPSQPRVYVDQRSASGLVSHSQLLLGLIECQSFVVWPCGLYSLAISLQSVGVMTSRQANWHLYLACICVIWLYHAVTAVGIPALPNQFPPFPCTALQSGRADVPVHTWHGDRYCGVLPCEEESRAGTNSFLCWLQHL